VLHALVTCITIAATPFYPNSEGQTFVVNLFTYAHSIMTCGLGLGLLKLKKRMDENQTFVADEADYDGRAPGETFEYRLITSNVMRWIMAILLICINGFIVFAPLKNSKNPNGDRRIINSRLLPAVVWSMYALGALAGLYILFFSTQFEFKNSVGDSRKLGFLRYDLRRWIFRLPKMNSPLLWESWKTIFTPQPKDVRNRRWWQNGEAETAEALRIEFGPETEREKYGKDPSGEGTPEQQDLYRRQQENLTMLRRRRRWMRERAADELQPLTPATGPNVTASGPSYSHANGVTVV
jgi:hypothetical protein